MGFPVRRLAGILSLLVLLAVVARWKVAEPVSTRPFPWPIRYVSDYERGPNVSAAAAVLMEASTGTVLYARNEHQPRPPASTTKIMTALLALERGHLGQRISISHRATRIGGSTITLHPGEVLTLEELLQGLLLESGNDAAVAIAEGLAGSVPAFVALMNQRARELGAWNTCFANPHGLPERGRLHYSTAFDLALIARRALEIPRFRELVRSRTAELSGDEQRWARHLRNTNRLLWYFLGADGVKTGTTRAAGQCLVASATRDGWRLIAVVLRSANRWRDAAALLDYGFQNFVPVLLGRWQDEVARVPVVRGAASDVGLALVRDAVVVVRCEEAERLETRLELPTCLVAPLLPGEVVGRLRVFLDGCELTSFPLTVRTPVRRRFLP